MIQGSTEEIGTQPVKMENMKSDLSHTAPRSHRWVMASHRAAHIAYPIERAALVAKLQGLGCLDETLFDVDAGYVGGDGYITPDKGIMELNAHLTLSYLWVLGAYEIVRILHERSRINGFVADKKLESVYRNFTRVRIPLAKFEPAGKHRETDENLALPALNSLYGVAWEISQDTFIARGELSDSLLDYLESLPPASSA